MTGPIAARVRRTVLPNGLTVLLDHDPDSVAVAIVTLVRAGFLDEPDEWAGISHVLEHMFFKGTPRHGPGELARLTKAAGGWLNAGTGYDHTTYYAVLPAPAMATGLALQADALRHAVLDPGELARELGVIIEEAKRKRDTPGAVAHETMHAVLFDHHRIRRWRIGEEAQLAAFTRDDVAGYYQSRYVPGRTIVAIAGGIDPDEALAQVAAQLGDWMADAPPPPPGPEEPSRHEVRARTLRRDVTQAELVLGWRTVPPLDPDATALEVAAGVLSAGRSAWLPRALRETGLVLSVSAHQFAPTEVGVFSVNAELAPERLGEVLDVTARTLARLATRGPSTEDLSRVRTLLRARMARRLESAESRAMLLAEAEALRDVGWIDEWMSRMEAVTASQVRDAASRWLRPDAVAGVFLAPESSPEDLSPERLRECFRPRATGRAVVRAGGTRVVRLPAVDVVTRRKAGAPLVTVGCFRHRHLADAPDEAGLGALAVRTAVRGAGGLDAAALAGAFERLGGPVSATVTADYFGFSATVLSEHLLDAAGLLDRVLREPHFDPARLAVERDTLAREAVQASDDMVRYPFQLALGAAFRDQGYGLPTLGTPASVPGLGEAAVRRWHAAELATGRGLVVAVGDLDPDRAAEELANELAGLDAPGPGGPGLSQVVAPAPGDERRLVARERAQTALAMAFPGPARTDGSRFAAETWATAAGGLGGRLFETLRSRRSLAYTVMASAWQRLGTGALLTYIATSPEREGEAREQMLAELDAFRREGLMPEELDRARGYLVGQAAVGRQTSASVAGELVDLWLAGDPLESYEAPEAPYQAVSLEAVHEVLARGLLSDGRAEGVVRGRQAREP